MMVVMYALLQTRKSPVYADPNRSGKGTHVALRRARLLEMPRRVRIYRAMPFALATVL